MKPTAGQPILDFWQPPAGAGAPVAVLATTFALEADFVDRDCLSRFLEVSGIDESTEAGTSRTVDDIVSRIELEDLLSGVTVSVLADRSSIQARSTLRWDLLPVAVPGGLLHSKVAVLMWENATRVLIGSANLTSAGYRRQVEMMLPIDLGPDCLLTGTDLRELADELRSYLDLMPGHGPGLPAWDRAAASIEQFRMRTLDVPDSWGRRRLRTVLAPSSPLPAGTGRSQRRPLDRFDDVWRSFARPNHLRQVSPYYDMDDEAATREIVETILRRWGRSTCMHEVLTLVDPSGNVPVPRYLREKATTTSLLNVTDQERRLHAKCLVATSGDGIAVLVGSSNHTAKGLGVGTARGHREMNIWLCAPTSATREFRALDTLVRGGDAFGPELESCTAEQLRDEDEDPNVSLPTGFEICRAGRDASTGRWVLRFQVERLSIAQLENWHIRLHDRRIYDAERWEDDGRPEQWELWLAAPEPPTAVDVEWVKRAATPTETGGAATAVWAVIVDDLSALPPAPEVSKLPSSLLFSALSRGLSLAEAAAGYLEDREAAATGGTEVDYLALHDDPSHLLRRGRALATALDGLKDRLSAPLFRVNDAEQLRRRLFSTLGPVGLATHLLQDVESNVLAVTEAAFTVAEIVLVCSRVSWHEVIAHGDAESRAVLGDALVALHDVAEDLPALPEEFRNYQLRAFDRAHSCIAI